MKPTPLPTAKFNCVSVSYPSLYTNTVWVEKNILILQNTWNITTPTNIMNAFLDPGENNAFMAIQSC
jgi:hypothetical protein